MGSNMVLLLGISCFALSAFLLSNVILVRIEKLRAQKATRKRLGVADQKQQGADHALRLLRSFPLGALLEKREKKLLTASYERDLPACMEVIALGMQSGMAFDQAFALYTERFDTPLALCCRESLSVWQKGLKSRDDGLRELSERIGTPAFRHFSSSVLRALRFGAPMTPLLMGLAQEARKEYRARRQEMVAKAPVKMLLPTGVLILPAMLLLVMGPIILDLLQKMG